MYQDAARVSLKRRSPSSDLPGMATPDLSCPICNADLPLNGDEAVGDEIFCTYCGAPCLLKMSAEDASLLEAEEDF